MPSQSESSGAKQSHTLTARQRRILEVIRESIANHGYPPSMREVGAAVDLSSPSSVAHQMRVLTEKGYLRRDPNRPRALVVVEPVDSKTDELALKRRERDKPSVDADQPSEPAAGQQRSSDFGAADKPLKLLGTSTDGQSQHGVADLESDAAIEQEQATLVPLVGRIAAGGPILAEQQVESVMPLPRELVGEGTLFMLEVVGDSMQDAAICDGDYVVIRSQPEAQNGEIVAALLEDEATVKTFKRRDGHVWLLPQNKDYEPILGDEARILGKVVSVIRRL